MLVMNNKKKSEITKSLHNTEVRMNEIILVQFCIQYSILLFDLWLTMALIWLEGNVSQNFISWLITFLLCLYLDTVYSMYILLIRYSKCFLFFFYTRIHFYQEYFHLVISNKVFGNINDIWVIYTLDKTGNLEWVDTGRVCSTHPECVPADPHRKPVYPLTSWWTDTPGTV